VPTSRTANASSKSPPRWPAVYCRLAGSPRFLAIRARPGREVLDHPSAGRSSRSLAPEYTRVSQLPCWRGRRKRDERIFKVAPSRPWTIATRDRTSTFSNMPDTIRLPYQPRGYGCEWCRQTGSDLEPRPALFIQFSLQIGGKRRADKRTQTAFLLITSDRSCVAGACTGLQMPHI
jgi:hypothetical protein